MTKIAGPERCNIPALHAAIAPPSTLHQERRALYQFATELLEGDRTQELDRDVVDSPVTRHLIGEALAGHAGLIRSALVSICAMTDTESETRSLRVASRPETNTLLAGALHTIQTQVLLQREVSQPLKLLTALDGKRFMKALAVLHDGTTLVRSINPELADDLLTHIALVAILEQRRSCGLSSGSSRHFPGLVFLSEPASGTEVAEALVHEGAHQKFFDLAITHDLFNADADQCRPFHPPWLPREAFWPLEQTLAAYHAYACLARFAHDAGFPAGTHPSGTGSLFPVANERSEILGQWLLGRGDYLGTDACTLLNGLMGQTPCTSTIGDGSPPSMPRDYAIDTPLEFRRCGASGRVLVGRPTQPPQLYWITGDAAELLALIPQSSLHDITQILGQRWRTSPTDATQRVTSLLSDLITSGLLTARSAIE